MLSTVILGLLLNGEGLTGYDFKKRIEKGIGVFYKASYGSLYPALKRLEKEGSITMSEDVTGDRKKKVYYITGRGSEIFNKWLVAPMDMSDNANVYLAKMYFFDMLSRESSFQQLKDFELNIIQYLRNLEALNEHFMQRDDIDQHYFKMATLYYGITVTKEVLRWCQHIKEKKPLKDLID